jgi:hypothetical protein
MARGKFNKRGGGPRLDAQNEEEIEIRNNRLAELEEQRQARREGEDDSDEEGGDDKKDKKGDGDAKDDAKKSEAIAVDPKKKPATTTVEAGSDTPAAPVTTEADHARNMKRLAEIRKRREEAEARRKMEEESEQQLEEERKQLAALATGGGGGFDDGDGDDKKKKSSGSKSILKLDKIAIKKLKPAQMKEALKERGLDYQGNAKALTDRLIKYESER